MLIYQDQNESIPGVEALEYVGFGFLKTRVLDREKSSMGDAEKLFVLFNVFCSN